MGCVENFVVAGGIAHVIDGESGFGEGKPGVGSGSGGWCGQVAVGVDVVEKAIGDHSGACGGEKGESSREVDGIPVEFVACDFVAEGKFWLAHGVVLCCFVDFKRSGREGQRFIVEGSGGGKGRAEGVLVSGGASASAEPWLQRGQ